MSEDIDEDEIDLRHKAGVAAEFVGTFLMNRHRGVIDCGDHLVIYGNDGYATDPRSRREASLVMEVVGDATPALGVCKDGYTWAVVVTDHQRSAFDARWLTKIVWRAWTTACEEMDRSSNQEGAMAADPEARV